MRGRLYQGPHGSWSRGRLRCLLPLSTHLGANFSNRFIGLCFDLLLGHVLERLPHLREDTGKPCPLLIHAVKCGKIPWGHDGRNGDAASLNDDTALATVHRVENLRQLVACLCCFYYFIGWFFLLCHIHTSSPHDVVRTRTYYGNSIEKAIPKIFSMKTGAGSRVNVASA